MERIEESEGRRLFGIDADEYDKARPAYPDAIYSLMVGQGALFPGVTTLEIGPGSGIATRRLIEAGANPVTLVEPDERFNELLSELGSRSPSEVRILNCAFEDAELVDGSFDLAVAATAFHWLDPDTRVKSLARLLRPWGHAALIWNLFQDETKRDDFHDATRHLLAHLFTSPSGSPETSPFALDRAAREREFVGSGLFEVRAYLEIRWALELSASKVRSLYQGFSSIARLPTPEKSQLLNQIVRIAEVEFGGVVLRNMTTVLYLFSRSSTD